MVEKYQINENEKCVVILVDPKIYSLDVIYTAAYVFLEKAYIFLEGDKDKEIIIKLTQKSSFDKEELDTLGKEFLNELINYSFYKEKSEKNKDIRQILLQRTLLTNLEEEINSDEDFEDLEDLEDLEEVFDDPEGIAIPWEEKYGKNSKKYKNV